ncbi:MAG: hypothetical protein IPM35_04200 [Myxococcales bacterium]|nr:hypothetical protein [Myxococcales bacterium]
MGDLGKDLEAVEAELLEHWNETRRRWGEVFIAVHAARQANSVGDDAEAVRRLRAAELAYIVATLGTEAAPLESCDLLFEVAEAAEHGGEHG